MSNLRSYYRPTARNPKYRNLLRALQSLGLTSLLQLPLSKLKLLFVVGGHKRTHVCDTAYQERGRNHWSYVQAAPTRPHNQKQNMRALPRLIDFW